MNISIKTSLAQRALIDKLQNIEGSYIKDPIFGAPRMYDKAGKDIGMVTRKTFECLLGADILIKRVGQKYTLNINIQL